MLKVFGFYLIVDGISSLIAFRKQAWYIQAVRVGRTLGGIALMLGWI